MFRSPFGFSYPLQSIAVLFFGNSVIYYVFLLSKVPSSSCMTYFHFSAYDELTASAKLCCSINYTKFVLMLLSIFLLSMSVSCCQTLSDAPFVHTSSWSFFLACLTFLASLSILPPLFLYFLCFLWRLFPSVIVFLWYSIFSLASQLY